MKSIFVTGTDTGVGKTLITGLLGRYLKEKGFRVITQKWVQTGSPPDDIDTHLKLMKIKKLEISNYLPLMVPYNFPFKGSPHIASKLEGRRIKREKIKQSFESLAVEFDLVVIEGSGGVLVPFNSKDYIIDIVKELDLPVLIVTLNKLGTINHTLLTIEALKQRQIPLLGIIFNSKNEEEKEIILEDNPRIIKALSKERILGNLFYEKNTSLLSKAFIPIGDKILAQLKEDIEIG